jgi:hypothetical protein
MDNTPFLDIDISDQELAALRTMFAQGVSQELLASLGVTRRDLAISVVRYVLSPEYAYDIDAVLVRLNLTRDDLRAATRKFESGIVLRLNDRFRPGTAMADRFVHPAYIVTSSGEDIRVANDPRDTQKQTISFTTR